MLQIFDVIKRMQEAVGHYCEIKISVESFMGDFMIIRADWWKEDFHAMLSIRHKDINAASEEKIIVELKETYFAKFGE